MKWLYTKFAQGKGGILGDDMGLGKTVQSVSLISAVLQKTGECLGCAYFTVTVICSAAG